MSQNRPQNAGNTGLTLRSFKLAAAASVQLSPDDDLVLATNAGGTVILPPNPEVGDRHEVHATGQGAGHVTLSAGANQVNGAASVALTNETTGFAVWTGTAWTCSTAAASA